MRLVDDYPLPFYFEQHPVHCTLFACIRPRLALGLCVLIAMLSEGAIPFPSGLGQARY